MLLTIDLLLVLQMNSLPSTLSAEQLFFDVVKSGLDVLTCELLNDGDRCTGIVELASDRDLKSCLKALTTDDGTVRKLHAFYSLGSFADPRESS